MTTKQCKVCGDVKEVELFVHSKKTCLICRDILHKQKLDKELEKERQEILVATQNNTYIPLKCIICSREKNKTKHFDGHRTTCKICRREKRRNDNDKPETRKEELKQAREEYANPIFKLKRNIANMAIRLLYNRKSHFKERNQIIEHFGEEYFQKLQIHLEENYFKQKGNEFLTWNNFGKCPGVKITWMLYYVKNSFDYPFTSMDDDNFKIMFEINNFIPLNKKSRRKKIRSESERQDKINNPVLKLRHNVSTSVGSFLKNNKSSKYGKSVKEALGETYFYDLKTHLEKQFVNENSWMNWSNYGRHNQNKRTWQLDHIKPHADFDYKDMFCQEFKECWDLDNLRPLD